MGHSIHISFELTESDPYSQQSIPLIFSSPPTFNEKYVLLSPPPTPVKESYIDRLSPPLTPVQESYIDQPSIHMLSRMQQNDPGEFEVVVVNYLPHLQGGEDTVNMLYISLITKKEPVSSLMRNLREWRLRNLFRYLSHMRYRCDEPCD